VYPYNDRHQPEADTDRSRRTLSRSGCRVGARDSTGRHRRRTQANPDDVPARDNRECAQGYVIHEIWLLRLQALYAEAVGDQPGYRHQRDRYRACATSLGFEGHMKWAAALP
jgi:hypothetical protein